MVPTETHRKVSVFRKYIQIGGLVVRRVCERYFTEPTYITRMRETRGKPTLVEIDETLLAAVKEEARRRGITYRAFFHSALARELDAAGTGSELFKLAG